MSDPTANVVHETMPRGQRAVVVANAIQIYAGALVGVLDGGSTPGYLDFYDDTETTRFLGLALEDKLGDTSATPPVKCRVDTSGVTLVGLDSVDGDPSQAKVGELVYCETGNTDDMTMTDPGTSPAIGILTRFGSATDCDVSLFTPEEFAAANV